MQKKRNKRRNAYNVHRLIALAIALLIALLGASSASAKVWTDQADYPPGSYVTIHGDNSDNAGYQAGETVHVHAVGPSGYTLDCDATADSAGAWSCQIYLPNLPTSV